MQLAGRDTEIARLAAALEAPGEHPLVVLRGEAGIGKTRLVGVVAEEALRRRFEVLRGTATELEHDVPMGLFTQALSLPVDSESRETRWLQLRTTLERTAGRPVVIVLDDVHWADPTSVELLELLVRRPPDRPHVLVVSMRPGPVADALLAAARAVARGTTVVDVTPLRTEAAETILGEGWTGAERARLVELSGGNPLFLEELARAGRTEAVPPGIMAAVAEELAALDEPARRLVTAGALLGDPFDVDLARRTAELELPVALAAIDVLLSQGLVRGASDLRAFSFRHPLVRSAVYESQAYSDRVAGHARAAEELAAVGALVTEQARHVALTASPGDLESAALLRRAAALVRPGAPTVAADWLLAAKRAMQGTDLTLFSDLAEALVQSGRLDEALAVAEEGLTSGGDDKTRTRFTLVAGTVERLLGRHDASRRRLTRGLDDVAGDSGALKLALALTAYQSGDYDGLRSRAEEALHESGDRLLVGVAASLLALDRRFAGRAAESAELSDRAVAAVRDATEAELAAQAEVLIGAAWALVAIERLEDALTVARRASEAARLAGNGAAEVPLLIAEVLCLGLLGRIAEAAEAADRTELAARLVHNDQSVQWALWMRAWVLLERGDLDTALVAARESVELSARLDATALSAIARTVLGAVLLAVGRSDEAEPMLAAYDVEPGWVCRWAPQLVEAQLALDDRDAATQTAARALGLARESGLSGALAAAFRARAMVTGDPADALAAIDAAEAIDARLDVAQGRLLAGRALSGVERAAAVAQLTEAHRLADAAGARRTADQAARELRGLGRRVGRGGARASAGGIESLSRRERDVAELVAQGLTNKEIAARLFLSEKTIESHLSKAFAKLDVPSRAALAAHVSRG